jgi:NAD(P)-dependent dehydrogenase (short-subunit alcohol dehydrogenase family)
VVIHAPPRTVCTGFSSSLGMKTSTCLAGLLNFRTAGIADGDVVTVTLASGEREMTARVYTKVWEMAALAGFLAGREVAKVMVPRGRGTILFTGATASLRGGKGFAAFAGAKHALRALAQSMARELGPEGIHVAHVVIDGGISSAERRAPPDKPDSLLDPDAIAQTYVYLFKQPRSAWAWEIELRPWVERF